MTDNENARLSESERLEYIETTEHIPLERLTMAMIDNSPDVRLSAFKRGIEIGLNNFQKTLAMNDESEEVKFLCTCYSNFREEDDEDDFIREEVYQEYLENQEEDKQLKIERDYLDTLYDNVVIGVFPRKS